MILDTVEDIRKKYKDTFLILEINKHPHLVYYAKDDGNFFNFTTNNQGELLVKEENIRENLKAIIPKTGLYNTEKAAIFFSRIPERQWKRGICEQNSQLQTTSITNYTNNLNINFDSLQHLFSPIYPESTKEGIKLLKKETIAINRKFGIAKAPKNYKTDFVLFYGHLPIGLIDNNKNTITVKHTPLLQEVKDYYYKKEPEWTILQSQS